MEYDYIVIGSGFGGSTSALRLTEKGYDVLVLEKGRELTAKDFPETNWNLRRWLWAPALGCHGLFQMRPFRHVQVLAGAGVGGGSLTYANTLPIPKDSFFASPSWSHLADWKRDLLPHYATARRMLGAAPTNFLTPADQLLKDIAAERGTPEAFEKPHVAVFMGDPDRTVDDPYFGGEGPARTGCNRCGACMTGCRFGAKNTLDKNYLYFAEKRGAKIFAETRVVDLRPRGAADGSEGYELRTERSTAWFAKQPKTFTARHVVLAASALGSMDLMMRMKETGALPNVSDRLGYDVRTNSESILGVRFPGKKTDMSKGIAIGSGVHIDQFTHIEATRYSRGSDVLGLIATMLVTGKGWRRIGAWMWSALRHPIRFARAAWPFGFARQTLILLVMQTIDATLRFRLRRRWWWPFKKLLTTQGQRIPTNIPAANAFAERAARAFGGIAITSTSEILFDLPMTAHCIGGCVMGTDATQGVIDAHHKVHGYHNLYVIDGAAVGANLGVNPSLTITALAERAMTFIPPKP